jgi:hypothetical protein
MRAESCSGVTARTTGFASDNAVPSATISSAPAVSRPSAATRPKVSALETFIAAAASSRAWRLFELNVAAARAKNVDVTSEEIEDAIEQALVNVRAERFRKPA